MTFYWKIKVFLNKDLNFKIAPKARDHDLQGCRPAPAKIGNFADKSFDWKYKKFVRVFIVLYYKSIQKFLTFQKVYIIGLSKSTATLRALKKVWKAHNSDVIFFNTRELNLWFYFTNP